MSTHRNDNILKGIHLATPWIGVVLLLCSIMFSAAQNFVGFRALFGNVIIAVFGSLMIVGALIEPSRRKRKGLTGRIVIFAAICASVFVSICGLIENDKINSSDAIKNDSLLIEWKNRLDMLYSENNGNRGIYSDSIKPRKKGGKALENAGDWRELVKSNQKQIESLNNKISMRESNLLLEGSNMESAVAGVLVSLPFIPNTKTVREAILRFFYGFLSILADLTATISFRNLIISQGSRATLDEEKLGIMGRIYLSWFGNNPEMKKRGLLGVFWCMLIGTVGIRNRNKAGTNPELIPELVRNSEPEQITGHHTTGIPGIEEGNKPKLLSAPKRNLVLEFMNDDCFDDSGLIYGKATEIQFEILKKYGESVSKRHIRNVAKTWGK